MKCNATTIGSGLSRAAGDTSVGRGCLSATRAGSVGQALHRGTQARRGSALILVLVCLVMMVLIGTAYIQVARVDRRATAQLTSVNNLDTVRDAVIAYVAKILKEDLIDADSKFFTAAGFDEPFDAPVTNTSVSYQVKSGRPDTMGNVLGSSVGGRFDDTWLADSFIDEASGQNDSVANPRFRQISDLNGIYLSLPTVGSAQTLPLEHILTATSPDTNGVGLAGPSSLVNAWSATTGSLLGAATSAAYQNRGVDTDGDGIPDARWTWAPEEVRQIGALSYVVAYRIIDLSSMINVNVATGTVPAYNTTPTDSRGYFPTDQSLSRLFGWSRTGYLPEIGPIHTTRGLTAPPLLSGTVGLTTNPVTFSGRELAWDRATVPLGAKYYGYPANKFGSEDELELRSRGGLNTATATPLENAAPNMLRRDALVATETTYLGVPSVNQYGGDWSMHGYFHGGHWHMGNPSGGYSMFNASRKYWATRHMFTTTSGSSIIAPQYAGWETGVDKLDRLKYDLVHKTYAGMGPPYNTTPLTAELRATEIRDRLEKIFKLGSPMYLGLDATKARQIATEYAVNIVDYSDTNNTPTALSDGTRTYYGLEALPFLREVYLEAQYEAKDTDTDPATYEEWEIIPQTIGIAIEIGNPFSIPLKFGSGGDDGAQVKIRIMQGTPASPIQVAEQVISPGITIPPRKAGITHNHIAIFHSGSTQAVPSANGGGGPAISQNNSLALSASGMDGSRIVEMGPDIVAALTRDTDIYIELSVTCSDGNVIAYDRLMPPSGQQFRIKAKETGTGALLAPKKEYAQISLRRDGRNTRYLSNRGRTVPTPISPQGGAYKNGTQFAQFGREDKGATGDANMDKIQIAHPNHRFFNVAELGYVFMYGFYEDTTNFDADFPARLSGKDGAKGPGTTTDPADTASAARHFLSFTNTGLTSGTYIVPSSTMIPHFSMVLDQFTTLSPRHNLKDEDNDDNDLNVSTGDDNDAEQFVPGLMNVNTAPWWLMAMASPLPESIADIELYYRQIGQYRDFPANRAALTGLPAASLRSNVATDKGIANLGELMLLRGATAGSATDTQRYGNTTTPLASTSPLRHYPHPDNALAETYAEDYAAQERMARFQFLSSSLSTRSDRYCAYIQIRGYVSNAFNAAPAEALPGGGIIVIFDRSGVLDIDSPVTVYPKTGQKN